MHAFFRPRKKDTPEPLPLPCPIHAPAEVLAPPALELADSTEKTGSNSASSEIDRSEHAPAPGPVPAETTTTPPAETTPPPGPCAACRQEQRAARTYRWKLITGLLFPFALQALDVTIIASALPWIATDFGQVAQLNWIIAAFNLTSAAFIPFWGQAADIVGRHAAIQTALVVVLVGSALCTAAPASRFAVLLLGRGVQGLGCAGLNVVVRVILLDRVSLRENAKNWSVFSFTAGMSYGIGPVVGGALTNVSWRWCFAINLPIGVAALALIYVVLRRELLGPQDTQESTTLARIATIDFAGQGLFLAGFGLLVLALTWAGATFAWSSPAVLVPLVLGLVLVAAFAAYECWLTRPARTTISPNRSTRPMLPRALAHKDTGLLFYINLASGAAMYAVLYFCNLYFTMVRLDGPAAAGIQLLYYTPGLGLGVYASMYLLNGRPRNTFAPLLLGALVEAAGIGALACALWFDRRAPVAVCMAAAGAGTGLRLMPASLHAVGLFPHHVAAVVSFMCVAVPLGGTLALTLMAAVFNNTSGIGPDSPLRSVAALHALPVSVRADVQRAARAGIAWAFVAVAPLMLACVVCALALGNVDITHAPKPAQAAQADQADQAAPDHRVVSDVYLLTLWRAKRAKDHATAMRRHVPERSDDGPSGHARIEP